LFSSVCVTYRRVNGRRLRRETAEVSPNPFAGLDAPLSSRRRHKHVHLHEPQPDSLLAQQVATDLAAYYSTQQYGGTVEAFSLSDGATEHWAGQARAGEQLS